DVDHVGQVIKPILDKNQLSSARQALSYLNGILVYADAHEYRSGDLPTRIDGPLGVRYPRIKAARERRGEKNNPELDFKRIGEFVKALRAFRYQLWQGKAAIPARALEFLILTAARVDQVTSLPWSEIDWEERLWVCPPERHKTGGKTNMD